MGQGTKATMHFISLWSCQSINIYWAQDFARFFAGSWGFRDGKTYFLLFPELIEMYKQKQCSRHKLCTLIVIVHSGYCNKNTLNLIISENLNLLLIVLDVGKSKISVCWGPIVYKWYLQTASSEGRRTISLSPTCFIRSQIPFMTLEPSWLSHFPKTSFLNIITLGIKFQHMSGGCQYSDPVLREG